ncbi:MAG: ABC transporter permease [Candidatus Bipolaricaulia bacterium]
MGEYIARRLLATLLTALGLSLLIFFIMRLIPGTVVEQLLGPNSFAPKEAIESLKQMFGLDRPLYVQYFNWMKNIFVGGWGLDYKSAQPVLSLLLKKIPVSAELGFLAVLWSLIIGVPMGVIAAVRRNRFSDNFIRIISTLGLSIPAFWQGTLLILLFSVHLNWMPPFQWVQFWEDPIKNLTIIALPALTLGTATAAMITRLTRSTMLEVLSMDYVQTARSKGLVERAVILKHALRNSLIPVITVAGVQMGYILGGIVVIEEVFSLPGVGRLLMNALFERNYPLVQGNILLFGLLFMGINLLVDLSYLFLDPRIRYE